MKYHKKGLGRIECMQTFLLSRKGKKKKKTIFKSPSAQVHQIKVNKKEENKEGSLTVNKKKKCKFYTKEIKQYQ